MKHIMKKYVFVDIESNGLMGQPFAFGVVAVDNNCNIEYVNAAQEEVAGQINPWVVDNVLPTLSNIGKIESIKKYFVENILTRFKDYRWVAHIAHPVETSFFKSLYPDFIGEWDQPFPLYDLSTLLLSRGYDPLSQDDFFAKNGISLPEYFLKMAVHNPLYDAAVTAACWLFLMEGKRLTWKSPDEIAREANRESFQHQMKKERDHAVWSMLPPTERWKRH